MMKFSLTFVCFFALTSMGQLHADSTDPILTVLKSPTCGCCVKWMEHLHDNGFSTAVEEPENLAQQKMQLGISARYRSCHTGVSAQGYIFEGHVPSKFIHEFLGAPPEGSIGLSVPGMPLGSPGMEVGDRFMPYEILLLHKDGSSEIYAEINSASEQYAR
ncbi:MAG: metal-binding protein [Gammaproteobacteria bacterium]|nr:metal-binding protein [Gammaproteobacteria bacterium]